MTGIKATRRFGRILVGYDGSQESEKAFRLGLSIANTLDSRLEILAVIQPGEPVACASAQDEGVQGAEVFVPSVLLSSGMCIVDTPGLGSVFKPSFRRELLGFS